MPCATLRSGVNRYAPKSDTRTLLAQRGLTVAAAERASGFFRGSLSRLLTGSRGKALPLETVRRLSRGTGIPLPALIDGPEASIADALERRRQTLETERARLEALLR